MIKELREEIKNKNDRINILSKERDILNKEIRVLRNRILEEQTGFKEGDIFKNEKGEAGVLVHSNSYGDNWSWYKLKKDGTPSKVMSYCYNNVPVINREES
jgi:hypothetical protein